MRYFVLVFSLLLFTCFRAGAQPKREFRAAWIATVSNIDWPSKPGLPSVEQQQQFIQRLDQLKALGCNTVIVQIRPTSDALYPSSIEPWSRFLTGRQGQPPFPYYDPLKFMIEETHKRNMEFHAWFNPFRALTDSRTNPNPASHVTHKHPDWIVSYGGKSYINPGIPEAREYVISVITDVVKRYDIDAVHLDDYFYPYRVPGATFNDYAAFSRYGNGMSLEDWRRSNVNIFISVLNTNIKHIKSYVKFGISPFGIWRNDRKDPNGSATNGTSDYDDLYADILLWMQKGWIDYVLPQIYWEHNNRSAAFNVLVPWWNAHSYNRQVFFGLALYRMVGARSGPWAGNNELLWQIRDIRRGQEPSGFAFYNSSSFDKLPAFSDSLRKKYNVYPALPPAMKWLDSIAPAPPVLKAIPSSQGTLLQWKENNPTNETIRYVVYRFINNEPINLERADRILTISNKTEFLDPAANNYRRSTYVVTAVDRLWNESKGSNAASTNAGD